MKQWTAIIKQKKGGKGEGKGENSHKAENYKRINGTATLERFLGVHDSFKTVVAD